ncbi:MAG: TatD family hydrolase [Chloroflexi bacterium]|nr:TatD family hydrolase [Chloroflexota bacterium]
MSITRPFIIDTHAHLDMSHFDSDRPEVIARALAAGVDNIICVGIDLDSSRKAIELAETYSRIFATAGIHPHEASKVTKSDMAILKEIAKHPRVVAIGETGLDFYRNIAPREAQSRVLGWQLELAAELDLPVVIHSRQAEYEMLAVLRDWTSRNRKNGERPPGVIHCFNGDNESARRYLDMGFFISIGAYIGYPASLRAHSAIRAIPPERLMVETDCPFLPPQSHRGKRNEPAYVVTTVELLAKIREVSPEMIAAQTTENARRLFRLPE